MPKQAELKKDDLEAVLEDGEPVIETEENEADFLAAFEDDDDGFETPEPDPVSEDGSGEAGEGVTDDKVGTDPAKDDDKPGDPKEGEEPEGEEEEVPPWLKHIQEMENRIASRMRNVEGHIGGLKSQMMQAKSEASADGDTAPTAAQIKEATGKQGSTEKLDALRSEFPEWADALDELAENQKPAQEVDMTGYYSKDQVNNMVTEATGRARELARVDIAHPGWEQLRFTPEFVHWRESQPEDVQSLADSPQAADAIKLLDLYAEATKTPEAPANKGKSEGRLKRSVAPRTTGAAPVQHVSTEEEDFLAAFKD